MDKRNSWGGYGGLGPDTDRDVVKLKSAVRSKIADFSNQLREINRLRSSEISEHTEPHSVLTRRPSARERALEFAKLIPRPKRVVSVLPQSVISARLDCFTHLQLLLDRHEEMELEVRRIKFRNNL